MDACPLIAAVFCRVSITRKPIPMTTARFVANVSQRLTLPVSTIAPLPSAFAGVYEIVNTKSELGHTSDCRRVDANRALWRIVSFEKAAVRERSSTGKERPTAVTGFTVFLRNMRFAYRRWRESIVVRASGTNHGVFWIRSKVVEMTRLFGNTTQPCLYPWPSTHLIAGFMSNM